MFKDSKKHLLRGVAHPQPEAHMLLVFSDALRQRRDRVGQQGRRRYDFVSRCCTSQAKSDGTHADFGRNIHGL